MTLAISDKAGIYRQRGFWLRCFLGRTCIVAMVLAAGSGMLWAKVEERGPMHLWRLRGFYMDAKGKPIGDVEVALLRDGTVRYRTRTDGSGRFAFEHVTGRYQMQIDKASDHSQLSREVIVGLETATMLTRKTLYIVAGPAACTDDCSSVFMNKSDFDKTVRRNTGHQD